MDRFSKQKHPAVILKTYLDDGKLTTGEKRQRLVESVTTPYCCHFDDDDVPSRDYSSEIIKALGSDPDVVGFRLYQYTDGRLTGLTIHSCQFSRYENEKNGDGLYRHIRTPNHLNPIRTEIARDIGFKAITVGEDADFATRLQDKYSGRLREVFIDRYLYHYLFVPARPKPPVVMYGVDGCITREGMEETIRNGGSVLFQGTVYTSLAQLDRLN